MSFAATQKLSRIINRLVFYSLLVFKIMPILSLEDLGPVVMRERAAHARECFRDSVWPIYGSKKGTVGKIARGDLSLVGTGILISIRDRNYVVTAAHVTDELYRSPLWIPRGDDFWPIQGMLHETVPPQGNRRLDVFDCCWVEVSAEDRARFRRATFLTTDHLSHNRVPNHNRFLMAYGYPGSKNKKFTSGVIQPRALSYTGCSPEPHETREELMGRRTEHIFLHYPRASVENEEAEHHHPIAPSGMSGGALIDLGDFSIPDNSIQSGGAPPLLAGILLEYHRAHEIMVALNIRFVTDAIENTH